MVKIPPGRLEVIAKELAVSDVNPGSDGSRYSFQGVDFAAGPPMPASGLIIRPSFSRFISANPACPALSLKGKSFHH